MIFSLSILEPFRLLPVLRGRPVFFGVICVGTTSCRTVESWAEEDGTLKASAGWTNIFIYPGYRFKVLRNMIFSLSILEPFRLLPPFRGKPVPFRSGIRRCIPR